METSRTYRKHPEVGCLAYWQFRKVAVTPANTDPENGIHEVGGSIPPGSTKFLVRYPVSPLQASPQARIIPRLSCCRRACRQGAHSSQHGHHIETGRYAGARTP